MGGYHLNKYIDTWLLGSLVVGWLLMDKVKKKEKEKRYDILLLYGC